MPLSFDLFDVFAFLDRPSLDKAAYVCRRFDAVIAEKRVDSWCLRTIGQVLVEGESTTYNITLWSTHRGDGRTMLQFRRANFQDKLRACLLHSVLNMVELKGVGVNEKFLSKLDCGLNQAKHLALTNVVFSAHYAVKLLLACFRELQSVRLAGMTQDRDMLDELLRCCSEKGVPEFHGDGYRMPSPASIVEFCFGGRDLPDKTRSLRFSLPRHYDTVANMPDTLWDDIIEANRECGHRGPLEVEFQGLQTFRVTSKYPIIREGPLLCYRENGFEIRYDSKWYKSRLIVKRNTCNLHFA